MINGVLFDLDGTLADTAPDLAYALNETLLHFGYPQLSFETIRPVVSHGGRALIELGFTYTPDHANYETVRLHLLDVYLHNIARETKLFPGMSELLAAIEAKAIPWGVVTNKPGWLTEPLMEALNLTPRAACIVSGDTTGHSKPHPEPLFYACKVANITAKDCLYIGDAARDIEAGKAAGMITIGALFGYLLEGEDPKDWHADKYINHPSEIIELLSLEN